MESIFIAEATIKKKQTKGVCYYIIPILGSSAGSREKRSHNCMMNSHWA